MLDIYELVTCTLFSVSVMAVAIGLLRWGNVEKIKFKNGYCSEACRTWFCCQDCHSKECCNNHCKYALEKSECKYFGKEEEHE